METISSYELSDEQLEYIEKESNETYPQETTWFLNVQNNRLYQVSNELLELHIRQSPQDIQVIFD